MPIRVSWVGVVSYRGSVWFVEVHVALSGEEGCVRV